MAEAAKAHITTADRPPIPRMSTALPGTICRPASSGRNSFSPGPNCNIRERLNCVVPFLDRWVAEGRGDEPCILSPTVSYTYRELQQLVNRIANVLVGKLGLVTGGRVLLRSANNPMMVADLSGGVESGRHRGRDHAAAARQGTRPIRSRRRKVALALCDGKLADEMEKAKAARARAGADRLLGLERSPARWSS